MEAGAERGFVFSLNHIAEETLNASGVADGKPLPIIGKTL